MSERHELKCWDEFYDAIERGDKNFEIRRNDRHYAVGDELVLARTDSHGEPTEPRQEFTRRVTFLTRAFQREGYVVMSLATPVEPPVLSRAAIDEMIAVLPTRKFRPTHADGLDYKSAHDLRDAILEFLAPEEAR